MNKNTENKKPKENIKQAKRITVANRTLRLERETLKRQIREMSKGIMGRQKLS